MEKNLVLAIALSLLILISWQALVTKSYHVDNQRVTTETLPAESSDAKLAIPETTTPFTSGQDVPPSSLVNFTQQEFDLVFIESQAAIKEITFKHYKDYKFPLKIGFLLNDTSLVFALENKSSNRISFVHSDENKKIKKEFIFSDPYFVNLFISIENMSNLPITINLPLILGELDFASNNMMVRYQDAFVSEADKVKHLNARKEQLKENIKFIGLRERYFCAIIEPEQGVFDGFVNARSSKVSDVGLKIMDTRLEAGEKKDYSFHIYLGPQELRLISNINPEWSGVVNYGIFDFISQILLQLLVFIHRVVHNWGWSIVILSCLVYLFMYPLSLKQMRSMKEMQVLQPKIEELRKIYKDNPQKLNKEIMELYREHKVNPLGGCLPLLLQMPIFIGLYQALMRSVVLRGANFLWIKDLSEPDRLFTLPRQLPIIGGEINLLPILMIIGMFMQQKMSMSATGSGSAEQQKFMMLFMLVFFAIVFYHMPSGLVLYWFINSTFMLINQMRIRQLK